MKKIKNVSILGTIVFIFIFLPLVVPLGIRVANDFPFVSNDFLKSGFSLPSAWNYQGAEGLGEYGVPTLWSWPFRVLMGILANMGFGYSVIFYLTLAIPIFAVGIYSIDRFLRHFGIKKTGRIVGGLLYFTNTYFLLLVDGGQLSIAFEYSLFPLVFVVVIKSLKGNFRSKLTAALAVVGIGVLEPRAIILLALITFLYLLWEIITGKVSEKKNLLVGASTTFFLTVIIFVGLNFYWILPAVLSKQSIVPPGYVVATSSVVTWKDAVTLHQPQWYKNIYGITSKPSFAFYIIPLFTFLSVLFFRKNRQVLFWIIVALLSVFMAKGVSPPFGGFYNWLFANIPGFFVFRDASKFFFLVSLSYSFLFGFTVDKLASKSGWIFVGKHKVSIPLALITIFLLFMARPIYLGRMTGVFSVQENERQFVALQKTFADDTDFGRVLWLPSLSPLSYSSNVHPSLEGLRILRERPIASGVVGNYELFNFLRESSYMGAIMDVLGVSYISYLPPDARREIKEEDRNYYDIFSNQIAGLPWIQEKIADSPYRIYKTVSSQDRLFLAVNTYYVVGSDRIYGDLEDIDGFNLRQNALIFAEEYPQIKIPNHAKIILYDNGEVDLAASMIAKEKFIFPADGLTASPTTSSGSSSGWKRDTKDFIWMRDFLQQKYDLDNQDFDYGGGYAISEGNGELKAESLRLKAKNKLLVRLMTSSRGGKVEFWQEDTKIGEIYTKTDKPEKVEVKLTGYGDIPDQIFEYDKADFRWFEVGNLVSDNEITLKTEGDINVVNSILSVTQGEWEWVVQEVGRLKLENRIFNWSELDQPARRSLGVGGSHNNAVVTYNQISPAHYTVKVNGLSTTTSLVFSESFNGLWKLSGRDPYKTYSMLNGFLIDQDGEYNLYFEPQKYVLPGLAISILMFIGVCFLCFSKNK